MKASLMLLWLGLLACSNDPVQPSSLYPGYFLSAIDGHPLPAPDREVPDGAVVVGASLGFPSASRPRNGEAGLASYTRLIRLADQTEQSVTLQLEFVVAAGELRINLCPPLALCVLRTELVGPADPDVLTLTHVLGDTPQSVYRFVAARPD